MMVPLPDCASGEWGPTKATRLFGLIPITHQVIIEVLESSVLDRSGLPFFPGTAYFCRSRCRTAVSDVAASNGFYGHSAQKWHRGKENVQICTT